MARDAIPINPILCERIRAERQALNLSQKELGDALHISDQSIRHYEKGKIGVNEWVISRMADFFGCSTRYLVGKSHFRTLEEEQEADRAVGEALSVFNVLQAHIEEKDNAVTSVFRLFFDCKIKRRNYGRQTTLTYKGREIVFDTREEWETFCLDFLDDAEKVFRFHLYELEAKRRADNGK